MKTTRLDSPGSRTDLLVFDQDDEVIDTLKAFATESGLTGAHFTAIGAFSTCTVAWFDVETKRYVDIPIDEQVEVVSLSGDVADRNGEPEVHAHVVVAKRDGTCHGGHLRMAIVRPTLELVMEESPVHLRKRVAPEYGIALIDPDRSGSGEPT